MFAALGKRHGSSLMVPRSYSLTVTVSVVLISFEVQDPRLRRGRGPLFIACSRYGSDRTEVSANTQWSMMFLIPPAATLAPIAVAEHLILRHAP